MLRPSFLQWSFMQPGGMDSPLDEIETKPVVWIIDSQQWPRANLRALLIDRGFDAIGFIDLHQALAALNEPDYPKPRVIVVELHDLSPTEEELETLAHLPIPVIALAGAVEMNQEWIKKVKWAAMIQRPVSIGQVADAIEKLMELPQKIMISPFVARLAAFFSVFGLMLILEWRVPYRLSDQKKSFRVAFHLGISIANSIVLYLIMTQPIFYAVSFAQRYIWALPAYGGSTVGARLY